MNFLFVLTKEAVFDLPLSLEHMGHTVTVLDQYSFDPVDFTNAPPLFLVENALSRGDYDYVINYLYIAPISDLCEKYCVPYISWIYDSPLISVFHKSVFNSMNRIFIFDHAFYERMVQIGVPHVYYMPLAAHTERINRFVMSEEDAAKYSCDISFVGSLYEDNSYNELTNKLPPEVLVPMNHYLIHNLCNWTSVRKWPPLPDKCCEYLTSITDDYSSAIKNFEMPCNMYLGILILTRKLAEMERILCLNTLAEAFPVDLYTRSRSNQIGILRVHPGVDYYTEIGRVYHFSKINLNITLPSIETGAPLRIFDIMAYGGFVLSNYQKDFDTLFTPGRDIAIFHDLGELKEQTAYYLSHEEERIEVAARGYETVNRYYSYEHQLAQILSICQQIKFNETGVSL